MTSTRNLLFLLAYSAKVQVREYHLASLLHRDLDWFEILTHQFATHLAEEWQRGSYRTYHAIEDTLPVLRGKWRITDQLRRPANKHRFAVAYDEFTADNNLNRVFRFVTERLWCLTRDSGNRQLLGQLRDWMDDVELPRTLAASSATPALITRLNQRFEPLLNLARLFLDQSVLQIAAGDLTTFAFMFDMDKLFEAFVVGVICRHRDEVLPSGWEAYELLPQARGTAFYLAQRRETNVFRLRPDLVVRSGNSIRLLVDTKYKRLNGPDARLGIAQDDFYQMHAYAHRYSCPRVLLLYPQTAEMSEPIEERFRLIDASRTVSVCTVDLREDLSKASERHCLVQAITSALKAGTDDGQ